jgi:polyphosphate kinase
VWTVVRAGSQAALMAPTELLARQHLDSLRSLLWPLGVRIDLIVRGVCSLRPGVKGVSETITVRSIIGRFLEHTRVFYFENGEDEEQLYLSSADWMERNFFRRVEVGFPIEDRRIRQRIIDESLLNYLADNSQAWMLQSDGSYKRVAHGNARRRSAQEHLLGELADT